MAAVKKTIFDKIRALKSEFHYFNVYWAEYHNANDTFYVFGYAESIKRTPSSISYGSPRKGKYKMAAVKTDF